MARAFGDSPAQFEGRFGRQRLPQGGHGQLPQFLEFPRGLLPCLERTTVEGGDHSFRVRGARRPDDETGRALGAVAAAFIREVA